MKKKPLASSIMVEEIKSESEQEILRVIGRLAEECLLSKLDLVLEEIKDFDKVMLPSKLIIEEGLDKLLEILNSSHSMSSGDCEILSSRLKSSLVPLIILVGEQHNPDKPWSSKALSSKVASVAYHVRNTINGSGSNQGEGTDEVSLGDSFLLDLKSVASPRKSLFFLCLQFLRPKLKRDSWKYYPAAAATFVWLLKQIKHPYLSDFVGDILSPSLLLADDYNDENKAQGISCLGHAIQNLNKTDLLNDNWGLVVYNAFTGMIHDKNPEIIDKLMPLLISILKVIEVDPNSNSHLFTKYDELMRKILFAMECCSERKLKLMWVHHLSLYLDVMGHGSLHWRDKICEILLPFTTINEPLLWKNILKCLQACIRNTWLKPNSYVIAEIILRLIFNCSVLDFPNVPKEDRLEIIQLSLESIRLMSKCSDFGTVREEIDRMKSTLEFHPDFLNVLENL